MKERDLIKFLKIRILELVKIYSEMKVGKHGEAGRFIKASVITNLRMIKYLLPDDQFLRLSAPIRLELDIIEEIKNK